ncbi:DUF5681 domain-containing protein [Asticcacaulis taihuensis]|uniref:DUF5681 domain-containing protein n=1 Tax=Asticcacaulis taihuensis TaxID=260084 RepID=UPI0026F3448F|nr:DUF5681 domain-containing protein [Asticcacaulis taihuensis]
MTTKRRGGTPPVEHRFKPGVSGNPGGRPKKKPTLRETAATIFSEEIPHPSGQGTITGGESFMRRAISQIARSSKDIVPFLRWLEGHDPAPSDDKEQGDAPSSDDAEIIKQAFERMLQATNTSIQTGKRRPKAKTGGDNG